MNIDTEKIRSYFKENGSCLKINKIEIRAGVPPKTLDHFISGRRNLPLDAADKIDKVLSLLRY
jgi:plasmid maintenance system antidote protein VapI